MCTFYFYTNFGNCVPVLIILLRSHSQMNCRKNFSKICNITSNLLPHYLVKIEHATVELYSTLLKADVMQNHLFILAVLSDMFSSV